MALIYDATFNTSTRLLTFLDRSGNTIYSFTVPARGIVDDPTKPLYLLSKQNGSTVSLTMVGTVTETYEYSTDEVTWTTLSFDTPITLNKDEGIYVRSVKNRSLAQSSSKYVQFVMTGEFEAYHNINSMITPSGFNVSDLMELNKVPYAFNSLFESCTSLTKAPVLYPTDLSNYCYRRLFYGCSNINEIHINATSIAFSECLASWDDGVSQTGDFYCYDSYMYNNSPTSTSGIPSGWTIHEVVTHEDDITKPLYLVSKQNGSTVALNKNGSISDIYQTSSDAETWTDYTFGNTITLNNDEGVYFRAKAAIGTRSGSVYVKFSATGDIMAYHNINSMVNPDFVYINSVSDKQYCLNNLFSGMTSLRRAPLLPCKAVSTHCYDSLFKGTSITSAPVLYASYVLTYSYSSMFEGTPLTAIPNLPLKGLASQCYRNMFRNCTSITSATLPATSLASGCYYQMFYGCSSLNEVHISAITSISTTNLENWLYGVAQTGDLYCYDDSQYTADSASGIPVGWTVHSQVITDNANKPLYLLSKQNGSTLTLSKHGTLDDTYEKSSDGVSWSALSFGTSITLNNNEGIYIRSVQSRISKQTWGFNYVYFSMTGEFKAYHNINSMLTPTGFNISDLTTISNSQYAFHSLFYDCSVLKKSPILPSTTLPDGCYCSLFAGCTGLITAPTLPATTLSYQCYKEMFYGCTRLTTAPILSSTTLANECYAYMFSRCSGLTTPPALPATTLGQYCYAHMFKSCTGLTTAPVLDAITLSIGCYSSMFSGCTGLTTAPALPATTLYDDVYAYMFYGCTGLTSAPSLPATTLTQTCYSNMFYGCSNLNEIHIGASDISAYNCLVGWLSGVSATGNFYCYDNASFTLDSADGIPVGWTKHSMGLLDDPTKPLYLLSKQNGSKVKLEAWAGLTGSFQRSSDGVNWSNLTLSSDITLNNGVGIYIRAKATRTTAANSSKYFKFTITGNVEAYHNVNSMLSPNFESITDLTSSSYFSSAFIYLFRDCTGLTRAPLLPSTILSNYCYYSMFSGCTGLTKSPIIHAVTASYQSCYYMFSECTGLTIAPELPATTLASGCYSYMFQNCTGLTSAPELPATILVNQCYFYMFNNCHSLNKVYISATDISASNCLDGWLYGVSATGDFYCVSGVSYPSGTSGIPSGWTRHNI